MKALLVCDIQNLVEHFLNQGRNVDLETFRSAALKTLNHARKQNWKVIDIQVDCTYSSDHGYDRNNATPMQKLMNEVLPNSKKEYEKDGHKFEAPMNGFEPLENEIVIVRKRASAFVNSKPDLLKTLDSIRDITLIGAATSGIILSTVRYAADLDYFIIIVKEAVIDLDFETHRILIEKIFPSQANVISVDDL